MAHVTIKLDTRTKAGKALAERLAKGESELVCEGGGNLWKTLTQKPQTSKGK